jgi:hypothetical protein
MLHVRLQKTNRYKLPYSPKPRRLDVTCSYPCLDPKKRSSCDGKKYVTHPCSTGAPHRWCMVEEADPMM